jgi:hypothetical protein
MTMTWAELKATAQAETLDMDAFRDAVARCGVEELVAFEIAIEWMAEDECDFNEFALRFPVLDPINYDPNHDPIPY